MSDPADKSDDLIAELAKLMATTPAGNAPSLQPIAKPAPLSAAPGPAAQAQPTPVRIPGMDAPVPRAAAPAPQPEQRAPVTGTIRIPGMDQPPPVSTTAPVSKFDFGKPVAAPVIKQEPLASFTERLAAGQNANTAPVQRAEPAPAPVRIPSDLRPVSESRGFGEGPALSVSKANTTPTPAQPIPPLPTPRAEPPPDLGGSDFHFDFGFGENPPKSATPPRPQPDPIADLIEAEMESAPEPAAPEPVRAAPVAPPPMMRTAVSSQPARPSMSPVSSAPQRPAAAAPIPLKPVSVAPRSPESDRFAISPGVGLNMKPPASQPLAPVARAPEPRAPEPVPMSDDLDPMSEIESLIGEAVRVELSPGPVRVQTPQQVAPKVELESEADLEQEISAHRGPAPSAPVVPPLTRQFAPRRANLKEEAATSSAEDAILAAAAASGADVGRIEPAVGDESPYRRLKVKPQRQPLVSGGVRQYIGMAVAGTLLLAAGLGLYWVLNMGRSANTGAAAPQLTADATPVKVKPAEAAKPATDAANSPVLAKMDGTSSAPSSEQLVSTDETNGGTVSRDVTAPATDASDSGLANRKVRTVTVRPDGTIVSGDDALAGGAELAVDRPNVPTVPSSETTTLLNDAPSAEATATESAEPSVAVADAANASSVQPVIDPTAVAPVPLSFPARTTSSSAPANTGVNALVAAQTPAGQIDLLGQSADPQVAKQQVAVQQPAPASSSNAAAYVQIASSLSEGEANAAIKSATAKYGSLFGGNKLVVQRADLGQKGVRYRVRLPAASLSDANSICAQIKAAGGDCFATNG